MRLLLVEDEPLLGKRLKSGLQEESFAVDLARTGAQANRLAEEAEYDLIILDLMLPDASGLELLERWREDDVESPVLVLTARDDLESKLRGFDVGADDYLTKPFEYDELLARIRSLLRRCDSPPAELLVCGDLALDRSRRMVTRGGREVRLTAKEFALLEYLMLGPGVVRKRLDISEHVWDRGYEGRSNVIDVMIGRLRAKTEQWGSPRLIHTLKGVGFVLRESAAEDP